MEGTTVGKLWNGVRVIRAAADTIRTLDYIRVGVLAATGIALLVSVCTLGKPKG